MIFGGFFFHFPPAADVAGPVLVLGAPGAAADAVDVLVALGGVLSEIYSCKNGNSHKCFFI